MLGTNYRCFYMQYLWYVLLVINLSYYILTLYYVLGLEIPEEMYVATATFILPINSVVNPLIYSDILRRFNNWIITPIKIKIDSLKIKNRTTAVEQIELNG